jgi:uncharacterized protein (TIGR03437 family)
LNKRNAVFTLIALALVAAGTAHAQTLVISPNPINLNAQAGGSPVQTSLSLTSSDGTTAIPFSVIPSVSWVTVPSAPSGGWKTPATVVVTVVPTALAAGVNTGALAIYNTQNGTLSASVPVNVTVSSISVSPTAITGWTYQQGSTTYPSPVTLAVNGANGTFSLSKGSADTWYSAAAYGSPLSAVLVSFNPSGAASLAPSTTPYAGTLTITPGGSGGVPITVSISLTVTASPVVTVSPTSTSAAPLVFNWESGGTANQSTQKLTLTSNASQAISINIAGPGVSWISLPSSNPTSIPANGSAALTIQVDGTSQGIGTVTGAFQISIAGALFSDGTTTRTIYIQLNVSNYPLLYLSQAQLTFSYQFGSAASPAALQVTPISSGGTTQPLYYNLSVPSSTNWLTVQSGTLSSSGGPFTVTPVITGLSPGTYTSGVIVTPVSNGSGQAAITIPVTLNVIFSSILQVNTQSLVFAWEQGQAAPPTQTISISSSTGAPLNYVITAPPSSSWVQVTGSSSGVTDQTSITVGINTAAVVPPFTTPYYDATINIAATDPITNNAVNTVSIDVRLYATTTPQLVVTPAGPLQFYTYPSFQGYPYSNTATVNIASTSSLPGDVLNSVSVVKTVNNQTITGNWLTGNTPGSQSPTSFIVNGFVLNTTTMPVGTYYGNVAISAVTSTGGTVADSPVNLPVTFVVNSAKGSITTPRSDGSMLFSQSKSGNAPASQTVQVTTDGSASLAFDAVANTGMLNWLTISSLAGPTPGSFNVSADASNLTTGTYSGAIWVTIPTAAGSPFRIPVTFNVTGGTISATPTSLSFTQIVGGATPAAQTLQIALSPSTSTAPYSIAASVTTPANGNWLAAAITSGGGSTPGTVTVTVTPGSLAVGTYTGTVTISSTGVTGSPIGIPVTLTVQQATISAPTTALTFNQLAGGSAPASQAVAVTSTPGPVSFSVGSTTTSGGSWLSATIGTSGTSGTTPGTVQVSVNGSALAAGSYSGIVTITSTSSIGSPISIPVVLNVGAAAVLTLTQQSLTFSAAVGQATTPQTVQLTSTATTPFTVTTTTKDNGTWLTVSPTSGTAGTTAVTLTVSANTQNLAAGSYSGTATISSTTSLNPLTINVSLTMTTVPTPVLTAVKNAASWLVSSISPGENIVMGGTGIGPAALAGAALTSSGMLSTKIGNTQVLFDGIAAPMIYASSTQTSVMVPYEVGGRTSTSVQIVYFGVASTPVSYNVAAAAPGIYTQNTAGYGPGVILNSDGVTVNGPSTPAAKNSEVAIYLTGEGATSPASTSGAVAGTTGNPYTKPTLQPVTATVGGISAAVQYAGSAPGAVYGVMQVNIIVPATAASGAQPLVINIGSNATQSGVTIAVQ